MSTPMLRIDTSLSNAGRDSLLPHGGPETPTTPTTKSNRARSLSQTILPALRISASPNLNDRSLAEDVRLADPPGSSNKARNESRKLLAHLLSQLQHRPMPPSSLQTIEDMSAPTEKGLGAVVQTVKVAVKHRRTRSEAKAARGLQADDSDSDLEDDAVFSTDITFDLMSQLKDVLIISSLQKWDILNDRHAFYASLSSYCTESLKVVPCLTRRQSLGTP